MRLIIAVSLALVTLAGCRVFELGSVISCADDAQCPQLHRCTDGRCLGPGGVAPSSEGEAEETTGECSSRADCDGVPGCVNCACDDGTCVAACVAGSCDDDGQCLEDGICHSACGEHGDCAPEEACVLVDDGSFFGAALCFDGCRGDSGCDAGQICGFGALCIPGRADSRVRHETCRARSECAGDLVCTGVAGAAVCEFPCSSTDCVDCCPVGETCSFFESICVERCEGCVGEACCAIDGLTCEEGDFECNQSF